MFINYGSHCVTGWQWHVPAGGQDGYTLWSVWGGKGELSVGDHTYALGAGDVFLIDYRESITGLQDQKRPLQIRFLDFSADVLPQEGPFPLYFHFDQTSFLRELFDRAALSHETGDQARLMVWLHSILYEYHSGQPRTGQSPYSAMLTQISKKIRQHPEYPVDIRTLAGECGISEDHFIRLFRAELGCTPYSYLLNARLSMAKSLLLNSSMTVSQTADACGFSDIYAFSRFFKKNTGYSPTIWLKSKNTH